MAEAHNSGQGKTSGKLIVITLFSTALLMWAIVFMVGLRQKRTDRQAVATADGIDSASTPEAVRMWLKSLPGNWIKVSEVEGQGWVLYVPCYSGNGSLTLRTAADSAPGIVCEYCDSLGEYTVKSILRTRIDSVWDLGIDPPAGRLRILPVTERLLKSFPEAPFKGRLLLWTRGRGDRVDSMVFVPKSQETEFETLRAEDENPEGCGEGGETGESGDTADST
ncbi:MAG: hypothetical protein ABIW76_11155 [Fibrobacteria bacterium]